MSARLALAASVRAVSALTGRDQCTVHLRGDQRRAVKVDEQVDHLARGLELVAAITREPIDEVSRADAAEPGGSNLDRTAATIGAQGAIAGGCGARDERRVGNHSRSFISRQTGFARLAEQVTATLAGPTQGDAVAVSRHLQ